MELAADFSFQPLPLEDQADSPSATGGHGLGMLAGLAGKWSGQGFNVIWRPHHFGGQDHFLELNVTSEQLDFEIIPGKIPNRGLLQPNMFMHGLTYLQQISDANVRVAHHPAGLHIEPGLWVTVPATTDPKEAHTVARLASIPHGTTVLAQGTASTSAGRPSIRGVSITPFTIGKPAKKTGFPEQDLATPSDFRTSGAGLTGVTQAMVDNPNSVLASTPLPAIATTTRLHVSTRDASLPGGGTANTAFLKGAAHGPNALAARVAATFWLQTVQGAPEPGFLQYSQTVLLNFSGLSWPHITVATLTKTA